MLGKEEQSTWLTSLKPGQKGPEMFTVESLSTCDYHKKIHGPNRRPEVRHIGLLSVQWSTLPWVSEAKEESEPIRQG